MLHALPESEISVFEMLPILIGIFKGSRVLMNVKNIPNPQDGYLHPLCSLIVSLGFAAFDSFFKANFSKMIKHPQFLHVLTLHCTYLDGLEASFHRN